MIVHFFRNTTPLKCQLRKQTYGVHKIPHLEPRLETQWLEPLKQVIHLDRK